MEVSINNTSSHHNFILGLITLLLLVVVVILWMLPIKNTTLFFIGCTGNDLKKLKNKSWKKIDRNR